MKEHGEELRDYFSAYVKKAIRNNSKAYHNKKSRIARGETIYENCPELPETGEDDVLLQIGRISGHFTEGITEIMQLLGQIEDYHLFRAVTELKSMQKNVIALRILGEKSFEEIGRTLGITSKKAENTYYNAIKKIRKIIGGKDYGI